MTRLAVLGATGYVGGRLVPELLDAGAEVRCLVRKPERAAGFSWRERVQVVRGDVGDVDSLRTGFDGVEAVYYLVHAMGHSDRFAETDRIGAANAAAAAQDAGVRRIVYLGGLGADDPAALSPHLASRHEVGRLLAAGTVPVTELRAAVIIGSGSASFEMLRHLVDVLPLMTCPRWVTRTRCQPIAIGDVLRYLVAAPQVEALAGRIVEVGGPDVVTYRDMMDRYAVAAGLRPRIIVPVPVLTPRLSSHWVRLVTPLPYGLARPLVDSLVNDVVVNPERDIRRFVDHEPQDLDIALARALQRVQDLEVQTSWTGSAPDRTVAGPMPHDPVWAGGTVLADERVLSTAASAEALFDTVSGVGGDRGWYVAQPLWELRGALDALAGGVGMRRGRRHPDELRVGDALDYFRVETLEAPQLLRLRAEMKLPGVAFLEWHIAEGDGRRTLQQLARMYPRGVLGRLYWWALFPVHALIFRLLAKRLVQAAEGRPPG
ncbi:MAG: SDR family oxidoreductase [bacterium]|nr:SDR family oxidoreductase [bacterium]